MRLAFAAVLGLVGCLATPAQAQAPPEVTSAELKALVQEDGTVLVNLEYGLAPGDAGTVPLDLLRFAETRVEEVHVLGGDSTVVLWPAGGSRLSAELPNVGRRAEAGETRLVLRYRIDGAVSFEGARLRGHIPVASIDWAPRQGAGAVFTSEVAVPEGWRLNESFPTGLRPGPDGGAHRVSLAVVPAVVSFRGRTDGTWRPGFPLAVDVLALLIFGTFTLFGWRHLRRVVA